MGLVGVVTWCGQWVVGILDYLVMLYPTLLVTDRFGSLIHTLRSIFVNCLYSLYIYLLMLRPDSEPLPALKTVEPLGNQLSSFEGQLEAILFPLSGQVIIVTQLCSTGRLLQLYSK